MLFRILAVLLFSALLTACGNEQSAPVTAPVWMPLETAAEAFQRHDSKAMIDALAPPLMQQRWARQWQLQRQQPVTDAFRARFAARLARWTGEGAERELAGLLAERAAALDQQKAALLPALRVLLLTAANVDSEQAAEQPGVSLVDSVLGWAQSTRLADRQRLLRLAELMAEQLRASPIRRWSDVERLDFASLLDELDRLLRVVHGAMQIYQLAPAGTLSGVTFETLQSDGERAMVRVELRLFEQPHRIRLPMVRRQAGWYLEAIARQAPPEPPSLRAAQPREP